MYFFLQFATFAILILAANTAYADFPRLSGIVARDGFLPRQLANRGDRLVFSNGIVALAVLSSVLIVVFRGDVSNLIPLYAVGVFIGFTLSQSGMVVHHWRHRERRGGGSALAINAVGALATFVVLLVVAVSKFAIGAWIPIVVIPIDGVGLSAIGRHYARVRAAVEIPPGLEASALRAPRRGACRHHEQGGRQRRDLRPLAGSRPARRPQRRRRRRGGTRASPRRGTSTQIPVPLTTLYSPYRELTQPILEYLDELDAESDDDLITVIIPEFITSIGTQWLHNQTALSIKLALLYRPHTVVVSVPLHVNGPRPPGRRPRWTALARGDRIDPWPSSSTTPSSPPTTSRSRRSSSPRSSASRHRHAYGPFLVVEAATVCRSTSAQPRRDLAAALRVPHQRGRVRRDLRPGQGARDHLLRRSRRHAAG